MTFRARLSRRGFIVIAASAVGCTQSSRPASWPDGGGAANHDATGRVLADDASRDGAGHPYDALDSRAWTALDAAVNCADGQVVSRDPRSICAVRCKSGSAASDVQVWVDQISVSQPGQADGGAAPGFVVRIVQTVPAPCDQTFTNVQTLWSGNFMNFSGQNGTWQFHLLPTQSASSGSGGDDNVEVYPLGGGADSGPVDVTPPNALSCRVFTN